MNLSTKLKIYSFISRFTRTVSMVCLFAVFLAMIVPLFNGMSALYFMSPNVRAIFEALLVFTIFFCFLDLFLKVFDKDYHPKIDKNTLYCID